jgi:uncharacterized protein
MVERRDIQALARQIAARFDPDRIILFGSHAYGEPRDDSDVDLLVIMPFSGKSIDQSVDVWKQTRPEFPVDLMIRRPEDAARRYAEWDPMIREAFDRGEVLYERNRAGMDRQSRG